MAADHIEPFMRQKTRNAARIVNAERGSHEKRETEDGLN
jgi:hypothetical protein